MQKSGGSDLTEMPKEKIFCTVYDYTVNTKLKDIQFGLVQRPLFNCTTKTVRVNDTTKLPCRRRSLEIWILANIPSSKYSDAQRNPGNWILSLQKSVHQPSAITNEIPFSNTTCFPITPRIKNWNRNLE